MRRTLRQSWLYWFVCLLLLPLEASAQQSTYPSGSVTVVVPLAAGGATDTLARALALKLGSKWGAPVIVENRPGGGGIIAARQVARAKPDGQTLLLGLSTLIQSPHLYPEQKLEGILDEVAPISELGTNSVMWIVRADSRAKSLSDLVSMVRADPATYGSFGSYGVGTTGHVVGLIFGKAAQLTLNHVPYRGEAPEITDLLGGHIPMGVVSGNGAKPHLDSGTIRVLATTGEERSLLTPEVPTFQEQGYRGVELGGWYGLFAPRGTPPELLARISKDVGDVIADPVLQGQFRELDIRLTGSTPERFASEIKRQYELWGRLIREAGVKGE